MSRRDNTLQRLYNARAAIAYAISLDGEVYGPVLKRIEREITARHDSIDIVARAMSILDEPEVRRLRWTFCGTFPPKKNQKTSHSN